MDFRNLKATDLKNNKRVILPEPDDDNEEMRRKKSEVRIEEHIDQVQREELR